MPELALRAMLPDPKRTIPLPTRGFPQAERILPLRSPVYFGHV